MEFLKKHASWFVVIILTVFFVFSLNLAWNDSTTMDEKAHIPASYSYVKYLDMRINPEHPPLIKDLSGLSMLFMLPRVEFPVPSDIWEEGDQNVDQAKHPEGPVRTWGLAQWEFGDRFLFGSGNNPDTITFSARIPIILLAVLLGIFIFWWTRELAGTLAGLFALLLYTADPNIIGHNHLVTTDVGIAAFIFFSSYFFVRFLRNPSPQNIILSGVFLGFAQLAKFSAIILFPLFGLIVILYAFSKATLTKESSEEPSQSKWKILLPFIIKFAGSVIVCFVVIWLLYLVNTWNMPGTISAEIARATFPNDRLMGRFAESTVVTLSNIEVLKPLAHYFLGVFMVFARVTGGNTYFFLGEVSNQASALYFPLVFILKETIPFLAVLIFGFTYGIWRIFKVAKTDRSEQKTWGTVMAHSFSGHIAQYTMLGFIGLYGYLSVTGNLNIGFRHLFPILPFLYVLGTKTVFDYWKRHRGNQTVWTILRGFIFAFALWITLIPIFAYPSSYLSYFNTATGGSKEGYNYVTDSNYDWGQDAKRLNTWVNNYNTCVKNNATETPECRNLINATYMKPNDTDTWCNNTQNKNNMLTEIAHACVQAPQQFPTMEPIQKIRVDYFGGSNPEYFLKEKFVSWHSNTAPEPGWYAISAGFYQESIYKKQKTGTINYSWIPKNAWVARAGDSIFIFYVDTVPIQTTNQQE